MRLRVIPLPYSSEESHTPYVYVFDRVEDHDLARSMLDAVQRFPEQSGGQCHGVIVVAEELDIE